MYVTVLNCTPSKSNFKGRKLKTETTAGAPRVTIHTYETGLKNRFQSAVYKLQQAEKAAEKFKFNGIEYKNISKHKIIETPVMKNAIGEEFWLQYSSSETGKPLYGRSLLTPDTKTPTIKVIKKIDNKNIKVIKVSSDTDEKHLFMEVSASNSMITTPSIIYFDGKPHKILKNEKENMDEFIAAINEFLK